MKRQNTSPPIKRDHFSREELKALIEISRDLHRLDAKALKEELARMRANFITYLYEHSEPL